MCRRCYVIERQKRRVEKRVYKEIGAKQYEGEGPPQAPPEEGMYNLGVVGSLLLLACTRSSSGGDVPGGDLMLDVGIKERAMNRDRCSMFNARNSEG